MGRDKALLSFGNQTLLESLVEMASLYFKEILVLADRSEKLKGLSLRHARLEEDIFPYGGPLTGLYTALSRTSHQWCCVLACDMPFVESLLIRKLLPAFDPEAGYDAFCLESPEGDPLPFPGLYSRTSRFLMHTLLDQGETSMKGFLKVADVHRIPLDHLSEDFLMNVNTPEAYRLARERLPARW